jgi:hypothetical protein
MLTVPSGVRVQRIAIGITAKRSTRAAGVRAKIHVRNFSCANDHPGREQDQEWNDRTERPFAGALLDRRTDRSRWLNEPGRAR